MNTTERKINNQTVVDNAIQYTRIWTFRTQEQMDLFINEMQGQMSDGKWENSRNTEWLWQGYDIFRLGEKTSLKYGGSRYGAKKTGYPLTNEDIDILAHRIFTENGFEYEDRKSLKQAWNEIADAIKNWEYYSEEELKTYIDTPKKIAEEKMNIARNAFLEKLHTQKMVEFHSKNDSLFAGSPKTYINFTMPEVAGSFTLKLESFRYQQNKLDVKVSYNGNEVKLSKVDVMNVDETVMKAAKFIVETL